MKIAIAFLLILFTINCYSQKITYHSLIGKWNLIDSNGNKSNINLQFVDSANGVMNLGNRSGKFIYSINDNSKNVVVTMQGIKDDGTKNVTYFFIKPFENNGLKIQYIRSPKIPSWNKNETWKNTGRLIKE